MTHAQPPKPSGHSLEEQLCDRMAELTEVAMAYRALERLVSPEYLDEEQANLPVPRLEMGALLHVLNAEMQRCIEAYERTALALQAQNGGGGAGHP